jgi:hypothetical protein
MKYVFWSVAIAILGSMMVHQLAQRSPVFFEAFTEEGDTTVIEIAGMPPQMDLARKIAAKHGWHIVCEGIDGERTVLHFEPGLWTVINGDTDIIDGPMSELTIVGSSFGTTSERKSRIKGCDQASSNISGGEFLDIPIGYGPRDELLSLVPIIEACGIKKTRLRRFSQSEIEGFGFELDQEQLVLAIDADGEDSGYYVSCAGAMAHLHLKEET